MYFETIFNELSFYVLEIDTETACKHDVSLLKKSNDTKSVDVNSLSDTYT